MTTQEMQIDLIRKMADHIVSYREQNDVAGELKMWININSLSASVLNYLGSYKELMDSLATFTPPAAGDGWVETKTRTGQTKVVSRVNNK